MMTLQQNGGAGTARGQRVLPRRWWLLPLVLIVCDLGLVLARALTYRAYFSMPGALGYLVEPVAALAVYAAGLAALPFLVVRLAGAPTALRIGTGVGLVGAAIDIVGLALESLWALPQRVVTIASGVAILALFLSFGAAGFLGARLTHSFRLGVGAAIWSALVAAVLTVTFGFLVANLDLAQLARNEIGDPDYLRSGWTDVRAFAIANTFDAGCTHLVEAPVIAAALGALGSAAGRIARHSPRQRSHPSVAE